MDLFTTARPSAFGGTSIEEALPSPTAWRGGAGDRGPAAVRPCHLLLRCDVPAALCTPGVACLTQEGARSTEEVKATQSLRCFVLSPTAKLASSILRMGSYIIQISRVENAKNFKCPIFCRALAHHQFNMNSLKYNYGI